MYLVSKYSFNPNFLLIPNILYLNHFQATNVVLPAGGYDPWSVLRVNVTRNDTRQFEHLTPNAAHCSDM